MLSPVLIGRDAELRTLVTALDAAGTGSGRAFFLTGDPGVGKSRLAAELSSLAEGRGFASYRGRAVQSASPVPFRPVTEALMQLGRSGSLVQAASESEYRSVLATLVPELGQPGRTSTEVNPLTVAEALLRVLALTGTGSILILEDLHWADPETIATVDYLADNLDGRRLLLVATLRDDEPSAGLDIARSIIARRSAELMAVPRLTEHEVEQMAGACLDADHETAVAASRLLANCDGLPFAVEEVLAAAAASGQLEHRLECHRQPVCGEAAHGASLRAAGSASARHRTPPRSELDARTRFRSHRSTRRWSSRGGGRTSHRVRDGVESDR